MSNNKIISAVIACYNDGQAIPIMHDRLTNIFNKIGCDYEIIFVNDGSPDNTESVLRKICNIDTKTTAIMHSRNFSSQNAFISGISQSIGDAVVLLDGDLQDPPEVLPTFFSKMLEGYDVVYAIRKSRKEGLFKKMCYFTFYRILKIISETKIPLDSGDFSVMSRTVVNELKLMPERNRFIRGMRAWLGYKQIGVEYDRDSRFAGKSKYNFRMLFKLAYDGLISSSSKPLRFVLTFGVVITITSFCAIVALIYLKLLRQLPEH